MKGITMNKTELVVAASAVTITVLAVKLHKRNRQLKNLSFATRKMLQWTDIAQKVVSEMWEEHPELVSELSSELKDNIKFYNILAKENLI